MNQKFFYSGPLDALIKQGKPSFRFQNFHQSHHACVQKSISPRDYHHLNWVSRIPWFFDMETLFFDAYEQGLVEDFIIHGSYGDDSYTLFSDLEITVVIASRIMFDEKYARLFSQWVKKKLNPFIVRVDALQHHGAFFLWPELINCYNEMLLPLCAYDECWSMQGRSLNFYVASNLEDMATNSRARYYSTLKALSDPQSIFFSRGYNQFAIKRMLSNFFMVPVFYFQSQGILMSKKHALQQIWMEPFSDVFFEALTLASELRKNWTCDNLLFMGLVRQHLVKDSIPQGRLDAMWCSLFYDKRTNDAFRDQVLPYIIQASENALDDFNLQ